MNFDLNTDQEDLRQAVRRVMDERASDPQRRTAYESATGYDPDLWTLLTRSMGLAGLAVEERFGGSGAGMVELCVVLSEMGRVALSSPYFATAVLSATAITHSGDEDTMSELLPRISQGDLIAAFAYLDVDHKSVTRAERNGAGWVLHGQKRLVIDGAVAQTLIVLAETRQGPTFFILRADDAAVTRTPTVTLDPTRRLARIELSGALATPLGSLGSGATLLAEVLDAARIALAAENVGGATRCLEMSVEHALSREQFGRPIGSFQAVKHLCADMLVDVQSARAAVDYAAWAFDENADEVPVVAPLTAAVATDTYLSVTKRTIQVHGGMGFTWEHPAHYYFKRAKSGALLFGSAQAHRQVLADRVGL